MAVLVIYLVVVLVTALPVWIVCRRHGAGRLEALTWASAAPGVFVAAGAVGTVALQLWAAGMPASYFEARPLLPMVLTGLILAAGAVLGWYTMWRILVRLRSGEPGR